MTDHNPTELEVKAETSPLSPAIQHMVEAFESYRKRTTGASPRSNGAVLPIPCSKIVSRASSRPWKRTSASRTNVVARLPALSLPRHPILMVRQPRSQRSAPSMATFAKAMQALFERSKRKRCRWARARWRLSCSRRDRERHQLGNEGHLSHPQPRNRAADLGPRAEEALPDYRGCNRVGGRDGSTSRDHVPDACELSFQAMELYAMPAASSALLDDSAVDIDAWIAEEVRATFAKQEGAAFITGNGVNKPRGFLDYTRSPTHPGRGATSVISRPVSLEPSPLRTRPTSFSILPTRFRPTTAPTAVS